MANKPSAEELKKNLSEMQLLMVKTAKKSTVEKTIQQLIPQERKNYES